MENLEKEIWLPVVGAEDKYLVSSLGRVKQLSPEKIIDPYATRDYYHCMIKYNNGTKSLTYIHRLVMIAFVGIYPGKKYVNHKNGIKSDNRLSNLEWCTHQENIRHSFDKLNRKPTIISGINNPKSKIILNLETGIFYWGVPEAMSSLSVKWSRTHFSYMLKGICPNKTSFVFCD